MCRALAPPSRTRAGCTHQRATIARVELSWPPMPLTGLFPSLVCGSSAVRGVQPRDRRHRDNHARESARVRRSASVDDRGRSLPQGGTSPVGRSGFTSTADSYSSATMSLQSSMHSSQIWTFGPAMSLQTLSRPFPQNEHTGSFGCSGRVSRGALLSRSTIIGEPVVYVLVSRCCEKPPVKSRLGGLRRAADTRPMRRRTCSQDRSHVHGNSSELAGRPPGSQELRRALEHSRP